MLLRKNSISMSRKERKRISRILAISFLWIFLTSFHFPDQHNKNYPKPTDVPGLLFYIQRSVNSNTIVYTLNNKDGKLNEAEPIKPYWIKYANKKESEDLSYIQRKYAYGVEAKIIDVSKQIFSFHFVSYKKRELLLIKNSSDNTFKCYTHIDKKLCVVDNIFVNITGGSFFFPKVERVDLNAHINETGENITEIIKP